MSLQDLIEEHATSVFLNVDHFAEPVYRLAGSNSDSQTTISAAIVTLMDPDIAENRGRGATIRGEVMLPESQRLEITDALMVRGLQYQVERIGAVDHGMKTAYIIRYEGHRTGVKNAEGI